MSKQRIKFLDLGQTDYAKSWEMQQKLFNKMVRLKTEHGFAENYLIFVEHQHVYTLGKSGNANNMLINNDLLNSINATFYHVDRGGDITYHGPGQIVGYPIFDLELMQLSYLQYIKTIEASIINYLKQEHSLDSYQHERATGVWIDTQKGPEKICAIGTKASRYITMHGFALNINTDLSYFNHINPCGFTDRGVTSLEKILGHSFDFENEKKLLLKYIASNFKAEIIY